MANGATPSLSQYFGQQNSNDVFDQIASQQSGSLAGRISNKTTATTGMSVPSTTISASQQSVSFTKEKAESERRSENIPPVVCNLFSTNQETGGQTFFDTLSAAGQFSYSSEWLESSKSVGEITSSPYLASSPIEDMFSKSLQVGNKDNIYDVWIMPEKTREILATIASSMPGTSFPERDTMPMPGVVLEEEMADTIYELVNHYHGENEAAKRKVLTANDVTQDDRGLGELIKAGCFRAAVNLTGRLLSMYGQGIGHAGHPSKHTAHSVQLWFTRIALLVKLHQFNIAEVEAEQFSDLDRPDLYFEYYPELYGGRKGSMVPFHFRMLLAELPHYSGKYAYALQKLYSILSVVQKILHNLDSNLNPTGEPLDMDSAALKDAKTIWESRQLHVLYSIANCTVHQKDFNLAVSVVQKIITKSEKHKAELHSALGRLYLQQGDVQSAQKAFDVALSFRGKSKSDELATLVDSAFMAMVHNSFADAYKHFSDASKLNPDNLMLINNMAVCLLYMGKLSSALKLLESAVHNNPKQFLHESALVNISSLYELESSLSNQKKLRLLNLVSQYKGDGVNVSCLKLQM